MFSIRFYNKSGEIVFGGGTSSSMWKITKADGLSFAGKTIVGAKYIGQSGQEATSVTANARTITLAGDITVPKESYPIYAASLAVLEEEGYLEIDNGILRRRIKARCCDYIVSERKGKYLIFTVQFLCDYPYFENVKRTEAPVFTVIPNLDKNFVFPDVFSTRVSRQTLFYEGNAKTEPVFYITVNDIPDGENAIRIINHTSGESMKFNYAASVGELITIDVENRKIYNSKSENLLKYLDDDSFFDGFHLYPGENDIEAVNGNMNAGITVICEYSAKYSEAVYI